MYICPVLLLTCIVAFGSFEKTTEESVEIDKRSRDADKSLIRKVRSTTTVCGEDVAASSGDIISPNYPNNYPNNVDCLSTITVPVGYYIYFTSSDFRTEGDDISSIYSCYEDYVSLFDGVSASSNWCSTMKVEFTTSSNEATLRFRSDHSYTYRGFKIHFRAVSEHPCRREISAESGYITSPNYPGDYSNNVRCEWNITVPEGKYIHFLSSNSMTVCGDYVRVYDVASRFNPIDRWCGSNQADLITLSNKATLRFSSDLSGTARGFKIQFRAVSEHPCKREIAAESGDITSPYYPANYGNNFRCQWDITVPEGKNIHFLSSDFEMQEARSNGSFPDVVSLYDDFRAWDKWRWGGSMKVDAVTHSNKATLRFTSDHSYRYRGFKLHFRAVSASSAQTVCGSDVTVSSVYILSPNYPNNYPNDADCLSTITVADGFFIHFTSTDFRTQIGGSSCQYDYVTLYDGASASGDSLGEWCGSMTVDVITPSNKATLTFRSNSRITHRGFKIYFRAVSGSGRVRSSANVSMSRTIEWLAIIGAILFI